MDKSLDDIIGRGGSRVRGRMRGVRSWRGRGRGTGRAVLMKKVKPVESPSDVRMKIIVKNRQAIHDARDRVAFLSKPGDVRKKLEKLKQMKGNQNRDTKSHEKSVRMSSISERRTQTSGRTTGAVKGPLLRRTIPGNILRTVNQEAELDLEDYNAGDLSLSFGEKLQRTVSNVAASRRPVHGYSRNPVHSRSKLSVYVPRVQRSRSRSPLHHRESQHLSALYGSSRHRSAPITYTKEITKTMRMQPEIHTTTKHAVSLKPSRVAKRSQELAMSTNTHLLQKRIPATTHGMESSVSDGFCILISNLHSIVSKDDILELFGDIGPLKKAELLTEGQAEVVFLKKEHALKAIEVYHNRQLDGKPMKCTLVKETRPVKPMSSDNIKLSNSSTKSSIHPEISIIHKALFNKTAVSGNTASHPMFTVTIEKQKNQPVT